MQKKLALFGLNVPTKIAEEGDEPQELSQADGYSEKAPAPKESENLNTPGSAEDWAAKLNIPLCKKTGDDMLPVLGQGQYTADIELVPMGKNSTYGLLGAPIHINNQAFCVCIVLKFYDEPVMAIDPNQWIDEMQEITNVVEAKLPEAVKKFDESFGE